VDYGDQSARFLTRSVLVQVLSNSLLTMTSVQTSSTL